MVRQVTAFDIGESMVKLVTLSGGTVKKAQALELPDQVVEGGRVLSMDALADVIKTQTAKGGLLRSAASMILPERQVFTRTVTVPPMTDSQLRYNLPYEFRDYLTEEKGQYFFDYAIQNVVEKEDGTPEEMRVFCCATRKQTIQDYREMFHRAGFHLKGALPQEYALGALVRAHSQRVGKPETDYCIVDIGHRCLELNIFRDGEFQTRRSVELGLGALERLIAQERGVDVHMAHAHLLTDYRSALSQDSSLELYSRMAVEIMKSVNFYNYNHREKALQTIYLCGGGAQVEPLRDTIEKVTGLGLCPASELIPGGENIEQPWLYVRAVGCALAG